jgi:hypothetical protein
MPSLSQWRRWRAGSADVPGVVDRLAALADVWHALAGEDPTNAAAAFGAV